MVLRNIGAPFGNGTCPRPRRPSGGVYSRRERGLVTDDLFCREEEISRRSGASSQQTTPSDKGEMSARDSGSRSHGSPRRVTVRGAMRRRHDEDGGQELVELAALADGSLAPERRAALEARVASSPQLPDPLADQQRALPLTRPPSQ